MKDTPRAWKLVVFVLAGSSVGGSIAGCEKPSPSAAASPQPTPEQIEQQRVESAKKAAEADRQLAAESAVKTLLGALGDVKSVSFEEFRESDQDDYQGSGRSIRTRFAAEVEASDDLVSASSSLSWQDDDSESRYREVPVLSVVLPKGSRVLVTGTVTGKSVAGRHVFQAQQNEVNPAPGVVLPPPDSRSGFNAQYALSSARLRSTFKDGVLDGSPEHKQIVATLRAKEQARRDAEMKRRADQRELEVGEVLSVLGRLASGGKHIVVGENQGGPRTSWLFGRSLSNLTLDAATGDGTGTLTNWLEFPPTSMKVSIRKFTQAAERHGDEQERVFVAIEPEEPGMAFLLDRADGAIITGRRVKSLVSTSSSGDYISLAIAGAEVPEAMAKWQAAVANVSAPNIRAARVLDKAGLQEVMRTTPFVDGEFLAAKVTPQRNERVESFRPDQRAGGYELYGEASLVLRSPTGVAVRSLLVQMTKGTVSAPELVVNGKPVMGLPSGSVEGGVLVEFSEPATVYEVRFGSGENSSRSFSAAVRLGLAGPG